MPELPELETIKQGLKSLKGLRISEIKVFWPRTVYERAERLEKQVLGKEILEVSRRAKFLRFHFSNGLLWIHLRMTGKLLFDYQGSYERLRFFFDSGKTLSFVDPRKFGRICFDQDASMERKLGLEPLTDGFNEKVLASICQSRRQLKPLLLDQSKIAGLGNIYVDEALWLSGLHPKREASTLKRAEIQSLKEAIVEVLKQGIEHNGCSLGDHPDMNYLSVGRRPGKHQEHLKVFRRQGQACSRCRTNIEKIRLAQRGTHFCPKCQR